jgi:hypothetical protein
MDEYPAQLSKREKPMLKILTVILPILFPSAAAQTITMGDTNIAPIVDSGNGNLMHAQQATLSQGATLNSLSFYVGQASGKLILGVYDTSGSGGLPGHLLAMTTVSSSSLAPGSTLSVSTGTWTGTVTGYAYQWQNNGTNISGATNSTYTTTASDAGANLGVGVTAMGPGGNSQVTLPVQQVLLHGSAPPPSNAQTPGPSNTLYNNNTYYTCRTNKYVSTTGSRRNTGNSAGSPWDFAKAGAYSAPAGTCFNLATGVYSFSGTNPISFTHGGTAPGTSSPFPATTYVVWRCSSMPFSYSGGALRGEGSGCVLRQSGSNPGSLILGAVSYMMFDGLELDGNSNAVSTACFDDEHTNGAHHHLWFMNMDIHGCGQSGLQINQTDWLYVLHNHIHDNSQTNNDGSGISFYEPVLTPSYTQTTQDGAFTSSTAGVTFHIVANYNVMVHNYNNYSGCTDGEGIIFDDWGWLQNTGTPYAGHGLAMGNTSWWNGGGGLEIFSQTSGTGQVWLVSNTAYNNYWSTCNTGTWRADILTNQIFNVHIINNIAQAVGGAGILANNVPYTGHCTSACSGNTWLNNVAYPSTSVSTSFDSPNTFPLTGTNKNFDNTNPNFTSVTASSMSNNFALQAGSPAIGIGQAFDLWQQSGTVDAGACPYSAPGPVTNCP